MTKMIFQFLDTGQGDGTLVIMGNSPNQELALVDFGEARTQFKDPRDDATTYLVNKITEVSNARKLSDPTLDHLFITHPHKDHVNAILPLIKKVYPTFGFKDLSIKAFSYGGAKALYNYGKKGGNLIDDISKYVTGKVEEFDSLAHSEVDAIEKTVDPNWRFAGEKIEVYLLSSNYPTATTKSDYNTLSLVLMFKDPNGNKVILMGDAGFNVEDQIRLNFKDVPGFLKAYALKLGHHGSKGSTGEKWLAQVQPKAVFASGDMVWHHPYCEAIKRVIKPGTLDKLLKKHFFCCGDSDEKDYLNTQTDLAVFLNLWYRVKKPTEKMTHTKTGKTTVEKFGYTCGVQWQLEFDGADDATFTHTDTWVPAA